MKFVYNIKIAFASACFFAAALAEKLVLIDDFNDFKVEDGLGIKKLGRSDSEIWTDGQIQFESRTSIYSGIDVDLRAVGSMSQLNFDFDVVGAGADPADRFGGVIIVHRKNSWVFGRGNFSGKAGAEEESIHFQWDLNQLFGFDFRNGAERIEFNLSGTSAETFPDNEGFVGARLSNFRLYLSDPTEEQARLMLAGKATASEDNEMGFRTGFMVGLSSTVAMMGMAAFAISKRKAAIIESSHFERLL